jgi:lipopolysaccharide transport system ATP-binding protein
MKPAIRVEGLSKQYRIGARRTGSYRTLREAILQAGANSWQRVKALARGTPAAEPPSVWALRDVSFAVQPGEVVGIIGRNGAGKSTLLKVLSQITEPTSGRVELRGRVVSLLEVGTGFHHELTGRENIYLNGAILGMRRREIARKFDDIVAFAEIDEFIDTPVKRYSSGMYVRLAFAVAAHLEPEILVVDEVLAVGDQAFQKKCLGKMGEVSRSGRTVLFVSHNMATVLNLCETVLTLERGRLVFAGACREGIEFYSSRHGGEDACDVDLSSHANRRPGSKTIFRRIRLCNAAGATTPEFGCGEPMTIELDVDPAGCPSDLQFAVGVEDLFGGRLFTVATTLTTSPLPPTDRPRRLSCQIEQLPLAPGRYALSLNAGPLHQGDLDLVSQAAWFDVVGADFYGNGRLPAPSQGRFLVRSAWTAVEP